ncbi:MAG TPA: hypothetical protein VF064_15650 [Pyrinomonadaceae bacterium]
MRIYEDYAQSPDGWNITSTLKLEDDGRFQYQESWTDFTNATLGVTAEGSWRRDADAIVLHPLRVEGSVGGWESAKERKAVERGDILDFGGGLTLRIPPEREQVFPVRNTGTKPLTVVLEPWGTRHVVAPGERARVVARGPGGMGELEIVRGEDEIVVYGWSESRVAVVTEPKPLGAGATSRAPGTKKTVHTVKAPVAPLQPVRVAEPEIARVEPLAPSPELAAHIRQWIDELPTEGLRFRLQRVCQELDALPLHGTLIYLWALRPDGVILCIDHEAFGHPAEPESDPLTVYAVLAQGARTHPELGELLPPRPDGVRRCELCAGAGWTKAKPPAQGSSICFRCNGLGWYVAGTPR